MKPIVDLEAIRDEVVARYEAGESVASLTRSLRTSEIRLRRTFQRWGIPIRNAGQAARLRPGWRKGGDILDRSRGKS